MLNDSHTHVYSTFQSKYKEISDISKFNQFISNSNLPVDFNSMHFLFIIPAVIQIIVDGKIE